MVIAGNKTVAAAKAAGIDVLIIPTDGKQLIAVQRTDLSMDDDEARALAVADNRSSELGLDWDRDALAELAFKEVDLQPFFTESELVDLEAIEDSPQANNADAEYEGMPEYLSEDQIYKTLHVHFNNEADLQAFAKLINQTVTEKTKYIWYPHKEKNDLASYKYQ